MSKTADKLDWTGRRVEVIVGPVAHGGHCVARHDGRVIFVRHSLPGERVIAEITEDTGGSFCRADAITVLEASAGRVERPCAASGPRGCGGCDWQHADAHTQRALKADVVAEQLRRLAGIDWPVEVEALPATGPRELEGWRTRTRLAVDGSGNLGFRLHRSHEIIPVDDCTIAVRGALPPLTGQDWPSGAEVDVCVDGEGTLHVQGIAEDGTAQVAGSGVAVQFAAGRRWKVNAHGFWQVHPAAADTLAGVVAEMARAPKGGIAWDLYGGAGLFASVLAEQVGPRGNVFVVESNTQAIADGRASLADLPNVHFTTGRVDNSLGRGILARGKPSVVVLDPPRKGAGRSVVDAIAAKTPARVVYVACDPAALARDIALFAGHGYELTQLRAFDAFPMTHHVECVALLSAR
ncbi:class I SAM-dependent RNA methyltransferase [Pseudonocardiaceae bacterium YIM PH 21723]|nr:class I SAM-dependent RNA methyltransferase [Pseudonocardiaceae bacterium YIM PH 21723]